MQAEWRSQSAQYAQVGSSQLKSANMQNVAHSRYVCDHDWLTLWLSLTDLGVRTDWHVELLWHFVSHWNCAKSTRTSQIAALDSATSLEESLLWSIEFQPCHFAQRHPFSADEEREVGYIHDQKCSLKSAIDCYFTFLLTSQSTCVLTSQYRVLAASFIGIRTSYIVAVEGYVHSIHQ